MKNETLHNYKTGEAIRTASSEELAASIEASKNDGGSGVILVDVEGVEIPCYVQ